MILTKEFVARLGCPDAEPWIDEHNFWGKTADELLTALEISNPVFYSQALLVIPDAISAEIISKNDFTKLDSYKVLSSEYSSFADAEKAVYDEKLNLLSKRGEKFYVNKITVSDSGDETWDVIDIDTYTEEGFFAVFNPLTGVYGKANSLQEAKELLKETKQNVIDSIIVILYQKIIDNSTQESAWAPFSQ